MAHGRFSKELTKAEVDRFLGQFNEIELSDHVTVIIKPTVQGHRQIVLSPASGMAVNLLAASFKDGMLHHWGWSERFLEPF
jgi:hypothetical protein